MTHWVPVGSVFRYRNKSFSNLKKKFNADPVPKTWFSREHIIISYRAKRSETSNGSDVQHQYSHLIYIYIYIGLPKSLSLFDHRVFACTRCVHICLTKRTRLQWKRTFDLQNIVFYFLFLTDTVWFTKGIHRTRFNVHFMILVVSHFCYNRIRRPDAIQR